MLRTKKLVVVGLVGLVSAALGLPSTAEADEPAEWVLENCADAKGGAVTKVYSGVVCDLKNRKNGKCLVQERHDGQVDWDFESCASKPRNMKLWTKPSTAINCGETFALKLGNEFFRKCQNPQDIGINICSETASPPEPRHFDWQLTGCTGQLTAGTAVSLYNVSRRDSIVYAKRPGSVIDTCWSDSTKVGQCTSARDK